MNLLQTLKKIGVIQTSEEALRGLKDDVGEVVDIAKSKIKQAEVIAETHAQSAENLIAHYEAQLRKTLAENFAVQEAATAIKALEAHLLVLEAHIEGKSPAPVSVPPTTPTTPTPAG